ncbi:MBL fold metallo-hydrolase [Deferribacterales bacterium RsTz2092]|nr:hypothetical protein AGMMS49941_01170 [Deferribacterales bacterium]
MDINVIQLAPLGANCVIVAGDRGRAVIVDPGGEPEKVIDFITDKKFVPQQILLTHGHFDHVGGVAELQRHYKVPVYIHPNDNPILATAKESNIYFGLDEFEMPENVEALADGDIIPVENFDLRVIHTPGHTPGGVCFYIPDYNVLLSGDTLFYGSVGRTDLPYSNPTALVRSITKRLYALPDDTVVISGHGEKTSIGFEAEHNAYVRRETDD